MAVVKPQRSMRDQVLLSLGIAISIIAGLFVVGVVAPIILAIIIGAADGH